MVRTPLKTVLFVFSVILYAVFGIFIILLALSAIPAKLPVRVLAVETGSMRPSIPEGSLIFTRAKDRYSPDDIITFTPSKKPAPATPITHRILTVRTVGGTTEFITKGDSNTSADIDPVPQASVIGKVVFAIPYIGFPILFAKTVAGFTLLVIIPSTIIIYEEIRTIRREYGKRQFERRFLRNTSY